MARNQASLSFNSYCENQMVNVERKVNKLLVKLVFSGELKVSDLPSEKAKLLRQEKRKAMLLGTYR